MDILLYVKMFCTNIVDSGCRQSLLSVPQGVSSAWGGRFLCSLAISPPPHILPPPSLPKPLHYSSSHYPHSQPLTDECVSRQSILPYTTSVISTHHQLKHAERNVPLNLTDYKRTAYENSFCFSLKWRVWIHSKLSDFTVKEEDGRRSFWNVKYFRACRPRSSRRGGRRRGERMGEEEEDRKWEKWGWRR